MAMLLVCLVGAVTLGGQERQAQDDAAKQSWWGTEPRTQAPSVSQTGSK